jgi:Uma2 family endonuclease
MGLPARKDDQRYTYRDYQAWPDDERWELIDGVAYSMSAPGSTHQGISMNLAGLLAEFLKGKPCRAFAAPYDVWLPRHPDDAEDNVDTVVQPDLLVTCGQTKIRPRGHWGGPDLVVEILSPSTSRKDFREKYDAYQRSGVKEYWVIDPPGRWVHQYVLGPQGVYLPEVTLVGQGRLVSAALEGFEVDLESLWPDF